MQLCWGDPFISKPPRSLACRDTLLTTKAILLTEGSNNIVCGDLLNAEGRQNGFTVKEAEQPVEVTPKS